jgi:hypothetical protein
MYLLHCRETRYDKSKAPTAPGAIILEQEVSFAFKGSFNSAMQALLHHAGECEANDPKTDYIFILLTVSKIDEDAEEDILECLGVTMLYPCE